MASVYNLGSTVTLNDGVSMPVFGIGTSLKGMESKSVREKGRDAVDFALRNGYRLIDTAARYLLGTGYIDLYLIHSPLGGHIVETYDALLDLKQQGLIRSVGVSNFCIHHLEGLIKSGRPLPSVNQIELNPLQKNKQLVSFCQQKGIALMGYRPLGTGELLENPVMYSLSKKHGKTPAQVMIRWSVQKGYITIPKSLHPAYILENSQVFDFELSHGDLNLIDQIPDQKILWDTSVVPWTG